ncbi:MAG: SPOR domain-containing protein [Acidiferrobacterales bacterium]
MPRQQGTETDFEPRHRILGAIVLVALGFILFSVVLQEQPQRVDSGDKAVAVAPATRVVVMPVPTPVARAPLPVKTKVVANPLAPKQLIKLPADAPAQTEQPAPVKPAVARATPLKKTSSPTRKIASAGSKQWMVQVGTFSDPANARRLSKKLKLQKYRVVTKVIAIKGGRAVRVRVGPYPSWKSAATARDRINKKNGIKGVVLAQK